MSGPWQLTNTSGEIVRNGRINSHMMNLEIADLPQGVYFFTCDGAVTRIVKID